MRQVERIIAPASDGRHSQKPSGSFRRRNRGQSEPGASDSTKSTTVIRRLTPDQEIERRSLPTATLVGEAGANLVLSRLQAWGFAAHPAMAGLPYDLIVEVPRLDLLRIQVKTRSEPTGRRCNFKMQRGYHRSRVGIFAYAAEDFELSAFVCLSMSRVFFYPGPVKRISVCTSWLRSPDIDRETFDLALKLITHRRNADALTSLPSLSADPASAEPEGGHGSQDEFDFGPRS